MTPTPNDLPVPTPLSPAAQFALDAIANLYWDRIDPSDVSSSAVAAAVLRAAAAHLGSCNASEELLAIATELEGHQ